MSSGAAVLLRLSSLDRFRPASVPFPLLVLIGVVWCTLALFGPKICFGSLALRGSSSNPSPTLNMNPELHLHLLAPSCIYLQKKNLHTQITPLVLIRTISYENPPPSRLSPCRARPSARTILNRTSFTRAARLSASPLTPGLGTGVNRALLGQNGHKPISIFRYHE